MSQKRLATLQAQNAALKAELANLQSLDAARTQASAVPLPAVIGGQQAQSAATSSSGADATELAAAQSEDKMRALFSSYDADASGLIDRVEFEALLADLGEVLDDAETTAALAAIDTSADGNISFDEFTAWFNNPERARASEKGFVHQQLLRFKLMAKLHAQRASSLASSVRQQDDEAALAASTVQFTTDIDLGSVPDDAPMKIAAKNRIVGPDTVAEILAAHSVPAGNSMWAIDLALEPEATAEAKQDAIDFVRNMFAQFVPLPPFVAMDVALAAGNDGAECLRITVSVPCEMLPVDAVLGAQFEAQAGLAGQRGEVSFAVSFDDIISNPDFVIADAFGLRMRGQAAMLRGANDFLKAVNPIAGTAASLFAGASIAIKIGTVTPAIKLFVDALNEAIEIFAEKAQEEEASGESAAEDDSSAAEPVPTAAEMSNAMSEEEVAGCCPDTITVDAHEHELTLSFGTVYGHGQFGCNVCQQMGEHGNYQCAECSWDAHPHCVVPALVESVPETALVEGDSNETSAVPAGAMLAELREQVEAVGNLLQPSALVTDQLVAQLAVMRSEAPDEIRAVLQQVDVGYVALRGVGAVRYVLAGAAGGADGQWQFHEFNVFRFMRHLMAASKNQALEMLAQQVAEQADQEEQEGEAQA